MAVAGDWLDDVEVVAIDPFRGYRAAVRSPGSPLAGATVAVDPFHVVCLANEAVTRTRGRVQQATLGHRGRAGEPLYAARKLTLIGAERLDADARAKLD